MCNTEEKCLVCALVDYIGKIDKTIKRYTALIDHKAIYSFSRRNTMSDINSILDLLYEKKLLIELKTATLYAISALRKDDRDILQKYLLPNKKFTRGEYRRIWTISGRFLYLMETVGFDKEKIFLLKDRFFNGIFLQHYGITKKKQRKTK